MNCKIRFNIFDVAIYCSSKSWPILYSKLLYNIGQDYLDIQYRGVYSSAGPPRAIQGYLEYQKNTFGTSWRAVGTLSEANGTPLRREWYSPVKNRISVGPPVTLLDPKNNKIRVSLWKLVYPPLIYTYIYKLIILYICVYI